MEESKYTAPKKPQMAVTLPSDPEAEKALLAILLSTPTAYHFVSSTLSVEDFYDSKCRATFDCVRAVSNAGVEISLISVTTKAAEIHPELSPADIAEIFSFRGGGEDAEYLARVLNALRTRRTLWATMQEAAAKSLSYAVQPNELIEEVRKQLDTLQSFGSEHIVSLDDNLLELSQSVAENRAGTRRTGTTTGFDFIDSKGGLQRGDLIVIAGETSQGKTSFAMSIALNALLAGSKIAYFSLEMSGQQLAARLVSMLSKVASSSILYNPLSDVAVESFNRTVSALRSRTSGGDILVDDRATSSLDKILASIRTMKIRHNISGVVVDFLQRLRPARGISKEQFVGEAAQRLKDVARELDIFVVVLSQLSRDKDSPIPSMNRLRDSGQVAEAADVVLLIYRPEAIQPFSASRGFPAPFEDYSTQGHAMIICSKGRNVGIGSFLAGFDASTTRFYEKPLYQIPTIGSSGSTRSPGKPF